MRFLPIDELNAFQNALQAASQADREQKRVDVDKLLDDALDFLLIAYFNGSQDAAEMLGIETEPNIEEAKSAINLKIAGKDYKERLREYAPQGDISAIVKVLDTDMTRIYNTGVLDTAKTNGAKQKTWHTMEDERVRDAHVVLDTVTVPIDADFYTDGDHAPQPGMFQSAALNCNCRCYLSVS